LADILLILRKKKRIKAKKQTASNTSAIFAPWQDRDHLVEKYILSVIYQSKCFVNSSQK